jgi:hypothetical protein
VAELLLSESILRIPDSEHRQKNFVTTFFVEKKMSTKYLRKNKVSGSKATGSKLAKQPVGREDSMEQYGSSDDGEEQDNEAVSYAQERKSAA